ncbi:MULTISPECIES: response regulator [unclassified Luteimonas]
MVSAGCRVLLIEDEAMLRMLLEDMVEDLGYALAGSAGSLDEATRMVATLPRIDAAIIDVNLGGVASFPLADELRARRVPFLFSTGYGAEGIPERFRDVPLLGKPYRRDDIRQALAGLCVPPA